MGTIIQVESEVLEPLVRRIVQETVAMLESQRAALDGQLAFSEEQAARLLGLERHSLRDERRRGRIQASQIVGKRIRYTRDDLTQYLMRRRYQA